MVTHFLGQYQKAQSASFTILFMAEIDKYHHERKCYSLFIESNLIALKTFILIENMDYFL